MSYSFQNNCYNCKMKEACTDHVKIQSAINDIHVTPYSTTEGHLGGGSIILLCNNHEKT